MSRRRPAPCPNCGEELDWEEVDIGVGIQTGPAWCVNPECGYSEDTAGLCEPDGRAPATEVPQEADVMRDWAMAPLPDVEFIPDSDVKPKPF